MDRGEERLLNGSQMSSLPQTLAIVWRTADQVGVAVVVALHEKTHSAESSENSKADPYASGFVESKLL